MELNDLNIFRMVAKEGSITKSAQKLGYVQSNISTRIQVLESELGTPLFYRKQGMILTTSGERLLTYAEQIVHLVNEACTVIGSPDTPFGKLSIGASHTLQFLHMPRILSLYHQKYPTVDLALVSESSGELLKRILHFELDCAFVKSVNLDNENIQIELTYEEKLVLIAPPDCLDLHAACSRPFLMNIAGCPNRTLLENWIQAEGITPIRYMEFNHIDSILEGVLCGLGVSFVPESAVKNDVEEGRLRVLHPPLEYSLVRTFLIRHKDTLLTPAIAEWIALIKNELPFYVTTE